MKIIFFIFLLLISYGCQPNGNLDFININNNQNKVITNTNQTEKEKKLSNILEENKIVTKRVEAENIKPKRKLLNSKIFKNFKTSVYYSKIDFNFSEKIIISSKPNVIVKYDYNLLNREKVLKSYKLFFKYKNNVTPIKITNYKNYNIKLIKVLYGNPDYIRREESLFTWQYKYKSCVIDYFFLKDKNEVLYKDIRSKNLKTKINEKDCLKEIKKSITK